MKNNYSVGGDCDKVNFECKVPENNVYGVVWCGVVYWCDVV